MSRIVATIVKSARILSRDRAGLAVLFVMPTVLVLVVTLVQEGAIEKIRAPTINTLLIDPDGGSLGQTLENGLRSAGVFVVTRTLDGEVPTEEIARAEVAKGHYQAAIVIAKGVSATTDQRADRFATALLEGRTPDMSISDNGLKILLDPVLPVPYRKLIHNTTTGVLGGIEMGLVARHFAQQMAAKAVADLRKNLNLPKDMALPDGILSNINDLNLSTRPGALLGVEEVVASDEKWVVVPTSVQQNVPAWMIFAMFLIIIPLAGSMIRERREGTLNRLAMIPGALPPLLVGKGILYLSVCMIQFVLMFAMGLFVLPLLGTSALVIGPNVGAVVLVATATGLAAVGFGMAIGAIAQTPEQASLFGATAVVILAAIGGIIVPSFAMPEVMGKLSEFSPLGWAQNAFLDLFLRTGTLAGLATRVASLVAFAVAGIIVALFFYRSRA